MKIVFIVPSPQWLTAAGVRIRYKRLEPYFNKKNCTISVVPIQEITERYLQSADVVIISKVFSSDSIYIMSLCRSLGVKVGIDLFDDYFSDRRLSVFQRIHDWLELASKISHFIICSTQRMKIIASDFVDPNVVHIINDTKDPNIFFEQTKEFLEQKLEDIANSQSLNILWFGIGDNPYFSVGLNDLSNYSNALYQINKCYPSINFTILTNERALTANNLTRISRLPIQPKLEIWTESNELEYLKKSHLAFMPVSHQKFSIAKSPNRCITALTYGCQVLSNGFDLYEDFSELIYKSTKELTDDVYDLSFKFNSQTLAIFESICDKSYDCDSEVSSFIGFLESKIFTVQSERTINFCMVNNKPSSLNTPFNSKDSLFPVIDGSTFSLTSISNFGIETYEDTTYFVFSDYSQDLLLDRWHKYLRLKNPENILQENSEPVYILSVQYLENIFPDCKPALDTVLTTRFAELHTDTVIRNIQRELRQSIAFSSLRTITMLLFGSNNLFFADANNTIQPFKAQV